MIKREKLARDTIAIADAHSAVTRQEQAHTPGPLHLSESPEIQWFDPFGNCRCGRSAAGILRGTHNESFGAHCKRCATKRLNASKKARATLAKAQGAKP